VPAREFETQGNIRRSGPDLIVCSLLIGSDLSGPRAPARGPARIRKSDGRTRRTRVSPDRGAGRRWGRTQSGAPAVPERRCRDRSERRGAAEPGRVQWRRGSRSSAGLFSFPRGETRASAARSRSTPCCDDARDRDCFERRVTSGGPARPRLRRVLWDRCVQYANAQLAALGLHLPTYLRSRSSLIAETIVRAAARLTLTTP